MQKLNQAQMVGDASSNDEAEAVVHFWSSRDFSLLLPPASLNFLKG